MLTVKEFAESMKVHPNTVYKWVEMGMPVMRKGSVIRIILEEATKWLKDNTTKE